MASEQESAGVADAGIREPRDGRNGRVPCANWGWFLLRGLLAIVLGVAALLFPVSALFAFTMVFAAYAAADGIASLVSGIQGARHKHERWGGLILRGLVGIAVGVVFLAMPVLSTITYALVALGMVAAWSILTGVFELSAAVRLRREIEGEWLLGLSGVLSILLGIAIPIILLLNPLATILSVAWIIGIYALLAGVVLSVQAFRLRGGRTG